MTIWLMIILKPISLIIITILRILVFTEKDKTEKIILLLYLILNYLIFHNL